MSQKEETKGEEKRKLLSPKLDVIFQALFGEVGSERMQILAELREKAIRDEKAVERYGYKQGREKGIKEIAKKMKDNGIEIEIIQKITNLTQEEIEAL